MKPLSLSMLMTVFAKAVHHVKYGLGWKAAELDEDVATLIRQGRIDCSGFVRWIIDRATANGWIIPDGSQVQLDYFLQLAAAGKVHRLAHYSDVAYAKDDPRRVFICFLKVQPGRPIGHVWLECAGRTLESHGSAGIDSRAWDDHNLVDCYAAFELPVVP